jgi:phage-related minor tail protein
MRDTMASEWIVDVASQVGGWFDGMEEGVRDSMEKIKRHFADAMQEITSGIGGSLESIGSTLNSSTLSIVGKVTTSVLGVVSAYFIMEKAAAAAAAAGHAAWMAILGPIYLVLAAIEAVISVMGLFGEESVEELKGVDKMMEELGDKLDEWADRLTDTIVDFVKTGKASFREFVDSVLEDMLQLSIRNLVVGPVFDAIGGAFAKGGAYTSHGIIPLAKGHVTNGPEFFTSGGKRYVRGEAGQEGVVPLRRMGNGDLGVQALTGGGGGEVQVIVNDYRTGGEAVQVSEQSGPDGKRQILVTIRDAIAELAGDGQLDRIMSTNWRLRRQPV